MLSTITSLHVICGQNDEFEVCQLPNTTLFFLFQISAGFSNEYRAPCVCGLAIAYRLR